MSQPPSSPKKPEKQASTEAVTLEALGRRVGVWARKVGDAVSDTVERASMPEALRTALTQAAQQRMSGQGSEAILHALASRFAEHPAYQWSCVCEAFAHKVWVQPRTPAWQTFTAPTFPKDGLAPLGEALAHMLVRDARASVAALRRIDLRGTAPFLREELACVQALVEIYARRMLGEPHRMLRACLRLRHDLPNHAGQVWWQTTWLLLSEAALAAGRAAEVWHALQSDETRLDAITYQTCTAELAAAMGDAARAKAALVVLGDKATIMTCATVALAVHVPATDDDAWSELAERAAKHADTTTHAEFGEPNVLRMWALLVLRASDAQASLVARAFDQLINNLAHVKNTTRLALARELAFVAMQHGYSDGRVVQALAPFAHEPRSHLDDELRAFDAWTRTEANLPPLASEWTDAPVPMLVGEPQLEPSAGVDTWSPLRQPALRLAVLQSMRLTAAALRAQHEHQLREASQWALEALEAYPANTVAQRVLVAQNVPAELARLEDRLQFAATFLRELPPMLANVSLEPVARGASGLEALKQQLGQPLMVAVMGEFSAGKSTFVNALVGKHVAPMGVLPTTSTINIFRHGGRQLAHVHYRDGRVAAVERNIEGFLRDLSEQDAKTIHHVDVELHAPALGEAAVVDTPGLKALDPYHEQVARAFIEQADAVVWVFAATQAGSASETGMLAELKARGRSVLGVLNKADVLSRAEQDELAAYLREQLGDVLVDIQPLRGEEALAYRLAEQPEGPDPFAAVMQSLEVAFLRRARALKRDVVERAFHNALDHVRQDAHAVVASLQACVAAQTDPSARNESKRVEVASQWADQLENDILHAANRMVREALAVGLVRTGEGLVRAELDPIDVQHVGQSLEEELEHALAVALKTAYRLGRDVGASVEHDVGNWSQGYVRAWIDGDAVAQWLARHGHTIASGENSLRASLRTELRPIARMLRARFIAAVHAATAFEPPLARQARAGITYVEHVVLPTLRRLMST